MNLTVQTPERKIQEVLSQQEQLRSTSSFYSSPDHFLEFALDSALALVKAHAGSLFLWDESQKALVLKTARGPYSSRLTQAHVRLREGVSGWVGDNGRSVLVKNIRCDDRFSRMKKNGKYKTDSFMSVPLIAANKLLGVINITERENLDPFKEEDFEFVRIFAQYIAIAFENMRLAAKYRIESQQAGERAVRLEQTLREQEPLVSVGRLASNLAHELNNPLDSIRRYVNLALDQVMEDSVARQYILNAKEGIRRAVKVVRGLLQYTRETSRIERRTVEIHSLIEKSLEAAAKDQSFEKIKIETCFASPAAVVVDCGLLIVFRNLFKNAHQAMGGEGLLTIRTRFEKDHVLVSVSDSGAGIPDTVKRHLFEPFFSTKNEEGTGIGLTICREVVQKCGGSITFDSQIGVGTNFVIQLPCKLKEISLS